MIDNDGNVFEAEFDKGWMIKFENEYNSLKWSIPQGWNIEISRKDFIKYFANVLEGRLEYEHPEGSMVGFYNIISGDYIWEISYNFEFYINLYKKGEKIAKINFHIWNGEFEVCVFEYNVEVYIYNILNKVKENIEKDYPWIFNYIFSNID